MGNFENFLEKDMVVFFKKIEVFHKMTSQNMANWWWSYDSEEGLHISYNQTWCFPIKRSIGLLYENLVVFYKSNIGLLVFYKKIGLMIFYMKMKFHK